MAEENLLTRPNEAVLFRFAILPTTIVIEVRKRIEGAAVLFKSRFGRD